jgi:hypothetical protein
VKRSVALGALIARARAEDEANRAERIRRGVEPPVRALEESPPVPIAEPPLAAAPGKVKEWQGLATRADEPDDGGADPPADAADERN